MPYKSDAQRKYMHAQHPEIAAKWDEEIRSAKKKRVVKPLDDEGLARAYKRQKHFTYTTSTLGLTGLGLLGASAATRKLPANATRSVHMNAERAEKIRRTGQNVGITAGGIGGLAGINWARIADAESRRQIRKSNYGTGYSQYYRERDDDIGVAVVRPERKRPAPFTISRKAHNPEKSRERRAASYPFLMSAGAGGTAALTVREATKKKVKKLPVERLDARILNSKATRVGAGTAATAALGYGAYYNAQKKNRRSYSNGEWYRG